MTCCSCNSNCLADKFFTKQSKRYLKQFRKRGLAKEQQLLVDGIATGHLTGTSVLEIGCGIGGLHLTLLQHGAAQATGVDIAEGMIAGARQLSRDLNLDQRTKYIVGDFMDVRSSIASVDTAVLDKVVCCYENVYGLMEESLSRTNRMYALSFPRSHALIRWMFALLILFGKVTRRTFRPYWRDWDAILAFIAKHGFTQTYNASTFVWSVHVFERTI